MTPKSIRCRPEFVGNGQFPQRIQGGNELRVTAFSAEIDSIFNGSPVISDGQILLRSDKYLYCIGK